ncbi:lipopolysaccharide assembly protein LapA domain-containing protein [Sinorhizobium sp. BG8]|uniref:lipopolysaccharide assembly protein LapA domain-containing protein n=1 Tax=Sinorhizobium sp. BG8 TaxID=2613773 RepID=UPI00193DA35B|nr:lipopolysaccharide assembly protein LapA domain-containing protein [Sinorhizobium sp. BG8]QRM54015.1 LapA family protein [Sinorhizobium sp. BG8]
MLKKVINVVILVPIAIVLIVLSVANRQSVTLALNPFNPEDSVLSMTAPFFVYLFVAVIFGMVVGSLATWFSQGKYRKRARNEANEALKWHAEAEKHKSRAETIAAQTLLPNTSR